MLRQARPHPRAARQLAAATDPADLVSVGTDLLGPSLAYYGARPHGSNLFAIGLDAARCRRDPRAHLLERYTRGGQMAYNRLRHLLIGCLLAMLSALAVRAHAVDGVIEINQARADKGGITSSDTPGLPITLSATATINDLRPPVSFRLTGSLSKSLAGDLIEIVSPNITLDLNGFMISCFIGPCSGKAVTSTQANVTVMNGTVRGFAVGAELSGSGARIENMRAIGNTVGLRANNYCIARNNVATGNSGNGIEVGAGCIVTGNTSSDNAGDGICALGGTNLVENTVRQNAMFGLNLNPETGYSQNVITNNAGGTVTGGVPTGINLCEGSTTCP